MRHELELMELVDRYLNGELPIAERDAFVERVRNNPELHELVDDQRTLHRGMQRMHLRASVDRAYRSYRFGRWGPWIGGAVSIAIIGSSYWMLHRAPEHHQTLPEPMARIEQHLPSPKEATAIDDSTDHLHPIDTLWTRSDTIIRTEVRMQRAPSVTHEQTTISEKDPDRGIVTLRGDRTEEMPSYRGGFSSMHTFLQRSIQYPDTVLPKGGTVTVEFLVDVDGSIHEARVAKGLSKLFDQEALRVIRTMPHWNPAKENGKPVKARIEVPIRFAAVVHDKGSMTPLMVQPTHSAQQKQ